MAEIIDITNTLKTKKTAEALAKDGACIYCHPSDLQHFDWLPSHKICTSATMQEGKPYVINVDELRKMFAPDCLVVHFDY